MILFIVVSFFFNKLSVVRSQDCLDQASEIPCLYPSLENLWKTFSSQSGSTTADTIDDTLTINGNGIIKTSIIGDTLNISGMEYDSLATVTSRGATTSVASSFLSGATIRGLVVDNINSSVDKILIKPTMVGIYSYNGTLTNVDLSASRTWSLPNASGTLALKSELHNPLTLAIIGSSPNAYGASLNDQQLQLQPADGSYGGVVNTAAQTFAGLKTFSNGITSNGTLTVGSANNFLKASGTGTLNFSTTTATNGISLTNSGATSTGNSGIAVSSSATTGVGIKMTTDSVTTGYGLSVSANALTTGAGVYIRSTSIAGPSGATSYLLRLSRTGSNPNSSHSSVGIYSNMSVTGTSSLNYAGYFVAASGGLTSTNYAGYFTANGAITDYALYTSSGNNYLNASGDTTSIGEAPDTDHKLLITDNSDAVLNVVRIKNANTGSSSATFLAISTGTSGDVVASDGFVLGLMGGNSVSNPNVAYLWNRESGDLRFGTSNVERMEIGSGGKIYLNSNISSLAGTTQALRINTTTWEIMRDTSSLKYKDNVTDINFDTSNIYSLRPVSYTYKADGSKDFGLIAEEVYPIIPQIVTLNSLGQPDGINYDRISVLLLNEMIKNKSKLDSLIQKVEDLESQIEEKNINSEKVSNLVDSKVGSITFSAGKTSKTIYTTAVDANSIIFTSIKVSKVDNFNVFITNQGNGYFKLELSKPSSSDVIVNWWVVN